MLSTKNYIFPSWWLRKITKQPTVNNPQQRLLKLNICHPDKWNYRHLTTSTLHSPVHTIDVYLAVATLRSGLWLSLINIHDVYGPHYTVPLRHGHGAIKLSTTPTRSLLYTEYTWKREDALYLPTEQYPSYLKMWKNDKNKIWLYHSVNYICCGCIRDLNFEPWTPKLITYQSCTLPTRPRSTLQISFLSPIE